jgi:hypothetical protein
LEFVPKQDVRWFTETAFLMPQMGVAPTRKAFFEIWITECDIAGMVQHEGADMRLFSVDALLREPRIVPWDAHTVILHARQDVIFRLPELEPPNSANS